MRWVGPVAEILIHLEVIVHCTCDESAFVDHVASVAALFCRFVFCLFVCLFVCCLFSGKTTCESRSELRLTWFLDLLLR